MDFRLANMDDLPEIIAMYRIITVKMNDSGVLSWDDVYPCDFFYDDIKNGSLYVLVNDGEIAAAFALLGSSDGSDSMKWEDQLCKALYLYRFGVNVNYMGKGIGGVMLRKAVELAKSKEADYLRLFVEDMNKPAMAFYLKNGFAQADGIYEEVIDDDLVLHMYGFELKVR